MTRVRPNGTSRERTPFDRRIRSVAALPIAIALLVLLSGNTGWLSGGPTPLRSSHGASPVDAGLVPFGTPRLPAPGAPANATLSVNASSVNVSSQFFGTTVSNEVHLLRGETSAVNATPARVLVWPGAMAGEDYDPFTQTHYQTDSGVPTPALTNESEFVQMCEAIDCTAIMQVPAEIDNPSLAEAIVNYTELNLSFRPAYWMIGNEPELWEHWRVPWKNWGSDYTAGPDPTQFGEEVVAYVKAIRAVDNTTPILGLPASGCSCSSWTFAQWISGVLAVTGDQIQVVAFHEYPAGWLGTGDGSLADFYGTLQGAASIPVRIVAARAAVQSACPGCNVSVFISELGAALSWSAYGQYAEGFSGALSIASQITQAMAVNVSNIDLFATELATTNSWFDPSGYARPDYTLYAEILDHLGTEAYAVNVSGLAHTVYAIDTAAPAAGDRRDLLVVNDNITHAVTFDPRVSGFPADGPAEVWSWNGSIHDTHANDTTWVEPFTPNPVPLERPDGLPTSYTLPPQSLVLFESYPSPATFVQVVATGVPSPTPWFASVGGQLYTTTADNLSLLLPAGSYPIASDPIPLPIGGRELHPSEHLSGFSVSPANVSGRYDNLTVTFVDQWRVSAVASPAIGGNVTPSADWGNTSQPIELTAAPAPGYAFDRWSGWGPGSYNGTGKTISIAPTGRILEQALFLPGEPVAFFAQGLPRGTPWSVSVRGFTTNVSREGFLTVYEPQGSYGFSVSPIPGFTAIPANGGFSVDGSRTTVTVRFLPVTPPAEVFPVRVLVSGLPAATPVPITVRSVTETSGASAAVFELVNGTYAYRVGVVPGYHPAAQFKQFTLSGRPVEVTVPFVPTTYPAVLQGLDVRSGLSWAVSLDGRPMSANSSWITTALTNGSYPFAVTAPPNYTVSPRSGTLVVDGGLSRVYLTFALAEFGAGFTAGGGGTPMPWSIRLGDQTLSAGSGGSSFVAPNGTYTFDVHPPPGYYAVPSHGTLTIAGGAPTTEIRFYLSSDRPSAALVAALSAGALEVSAWIGASVLAGFAAVRWLRRRGGPRAE